MITKDDYENNRLTNPIYEFIKIWTHATFLFHDFHTGGPLYYSNVWKRKPPALGYNINGCHALDWAAGNDQRFLGGSYVYNKSSSSLAAVGSTKVGGMLGYDALYKSLGKNSCLGQALVDWFADRLNSSQERGFIIGWHYGMMIVGDPLICFKKIPGIDSSLPEIFPPRGF